jgi:hypothetical protein
MLGYVVPITALWLIMLVAYEVGLKRGVGDEVRR